MQAETLSFINSNYEKNPKRLYQIMKVAGEKLPNNPSQDQLLNMILAIVQSSDANMKRIYNVINDKDFEVKLLIHEALLARAISKKDITYYLYTGEKLGDINGLISFLSNKENSLMLTQINEKIDKFKADHELKY